MVIKANIYRQSFAEGIPTYIDIDSGEYQRMTCEDCGGLGIYDIYDDKSICNVCKGVGYEWFNVY